MQEYFKIGYLNFQRLSDYFTRVQYRLCRGILWATAWATRPKGLFPKGITLTAAALSWPAMILGWMAMILMLARIRNIFTSHYQIWKPSLGVPKAAGCSYLDPKIKIQPWGERCFYAKGPFGNPICFVDEKTVFTGQITNMRNFSQTFNKSKLCFLEEVKLLLDS